MLSLVYRLASDFEREYGFSPNLLYLNYAQLECLKQMMMDPSDVEAIVQLLGMEIVLHQDVVHPQVSWSDSPWKHAMVS